MVAVQISSFQLCSAMAWDCKSRIYFAKGNEVILN
jgi:hypothetical protein